MCLPFESPSAHFSVQKPKKVHIQPALVRFIWNKNLKGHLEPIMASPEAEHLFNEEEINNAAEMFNNIICSLARKVTEVNTQSVKTKKDDLSKNGMIRIVIT